MNEERNRIEQAEQAAIEIATRFGIVSPRPRVLHHSNNVVLHLEPAPIVAKVAASSHRQHGAASLERELSVGRFLAARHAPTVPPAATLPAGPHRVGPTVLTFWQHCPHDPVAEVDGRTAGASLVELHAALTGYIGELPPFTRQAEDVAAILEHEPLPALPPDERAFLRSTHAQLSEALAGHNLPLRPLHGEVHLGNLLATAAGPRWIDFEAACLGPPEWDLTGLPDDAIDFYPAADRALLALLRDLRSSCVAAWCWRNPDRAPELREAAEFHLERLHARYP